MGIEIPIIPDRRSMRTKINWGAVFITWLLLEMVGIILLLPGPATLLVVEIMIWMR
jgi:hypothetical protein